MSTVNKFFPAVFVFSLSCLASFSVSTAAQEIKNTIPSEIANSQPVKHVYPSLAGKVSLQIEAYQNVNVSYLPVITSSNQEYIPTKSFVKSKGSKIFTFFTRFNDNLHLLFSWFKSENKPVAKESVTLPTKTCK